jgi:hypothetical protein
LAGGGFGEQQRGRLGSNSSESDDKAGQQATVWAVLGSREELGVLGRRRELAVERARGGDNGERADSAHAQEETGEPFIGG